MRKFLFRILIFIFERGNVVINVGECSAMVGAMVIGTDGVEGGCVYPGFHLSPTPRPAAIIIHRMRPASVTQQPGQ